MPYAKTSLRAEQRALREKMRELGMSHRQIAVEFVRRYRLRPRAAWRNAYGWSLTEAAEQISTYAARTGLDNGATVAMTAAHLCEHENWPGEGHQPAGRRPTPYLLSLLAAVYGCAVQDLLDAADYEHMPAADRLILDKTTPSDVRRSAESAATQAAGLSRRQPSTQSSSPATFRVNEETIAAGLPGELAPSRQAAPGQRHPATIPPWETFAALDTLDISDPLSLELGDDQEIEDPVRRRTFVGLTSTSLLASILDVASDKRPLDAEPLVPVLAGHVADTGLEQPGAPSDIAALTAAVNQARRQYQACRYSELIRHLPQLLVRLSAACLSLDGEAKSRAFVLSADTHHVSWETAHCRRGPPARTKQCVAAGGRRRPRGATRPADIPPPIDLCLAERQRRPLEVVAEQKHDVYRPGTRGQTAHGAPQASGSPACGRAYYSG